MAMGFEITATDLDPITFYCRNAAVPKRRNVDDQTVLRGKEVLYTTDCIACHPPSYVTQRPADCPEQKPPADMDLYRSLVALYRLRACRWPPRGTGERTRLSHAAEYRVDQLGVKTHVFPHDGRERSLLEAILWHGDEAIA